MFYISFKYLQLFSSIYCILCHAFNYKSRSATQIVIYKNPSFCVFFIDSLWIFRSWIVSFTYLFGFSLLSLYYLRDLIISSSFYSFLFDLLLRTSDIFIMLFLTFFFLSFIGVEISRSWCRRISGLWYCHITCLLFIIFLHWYFGMVIGLSAGIWAFLLDGSFVSWLLFLLWPSGLWGLGFWLLKFSLIYEGGFIHVQCWSSEG